MVNTLKFSQFEAVTLSNPNNFLAGINAATGGVNIIAPFTTTWTSTSRPASPYDGLIGYNTTLEQYEYWNQTALAWVQLGTSAVLLETFIVQVPSFSLPNAQALSGLSTGLLKNTTGTGVLSIGMVGTDYYAPGGTPVNLATGGTSANLTASNGGIFYSTATAGAILAGTPTALQMLQSGASSAPAWSTATWPATTSANQILFSSATNTVGQITTAASSVLVTNAGGVPSLSTTLPAGLTIPGYQATITPAALTEVNDTNVTLSLGGSPTSALLNATSLTLGWTGQLAVPRGGTGNSTFTAYSVICAGTSSTGAFQNVAGVGSAGQVLTSQGAGALPQWASPATSGTVTSIATNNGLTGGTITTTGTIGLATIANVSILANISGGSAIPIPNTLTAIIDACIGSAQGEILYRNALNWTVLAAGTAGQVLSTGGAAANPSWIAAGGTGSVTSIVVGTGLTGTPSTITTTGTIALTVPVILANGGTSANLTASNGGIFYSSATAGAILSGTATAGLALLSGAGTAPTWSTSPPITRINYLTLTAGGTYTPSTGTQYADFELLGAGGGGGGSAVVVAVSAGGGGGAGGYTKRTLTIAQIGASATATVPTSGGAGGAAGANNGTAGGNTSLVFTGTGAITITANGGAGGIGGASAVAGVSAGGAGGNASNGTINITGNAGQPGYWSFIASTFYIISGGAGGSLLPYGPGAPTNVTTASGSTVGGTQLAGSNASGFGSGGSGATATLSNLAGGNGAPGLIIIKEYISI